MSVKHTVIIGGGVIGAATAYYLTQQPGFDISNNKVTVIEAIEMHTPETAGLVQLSWELHAELAEKHGGKEKWWYRRLDMLITHASSEKQPTDPALPVNLDTSYLNTDRIIDYKVQGTKETSGQVTGWKFTAALIDLAKEKGVEVIFGQVTGAAYSEDGSTISKIKYIPKLTTNIESVAVTDVVLAAGPWSGVVFEAIKPITVTYELPIFGTRSHSIMIETPTPLPPIAVFTHYDMNSSEKLDTDESDTYKLEFYPRPDHLYVCGPVDKSVLPTVDEVGFDSEFCDRMFAMTSAVSNTLAASKIRTKQACYMPMVRITAGLSSNASRSAPPLIGKLPQIDNAIVATGHSCWGMTLGPATGFIVAEMLTTGKNKTLEGKIEGLDPIRLVNGTNSAAGRTNKWNLPE